jgi:hypothetical protein
MVIIILLTSYKLLSEKNQDHNQFWLKYSTKLQKELSKRYPFTAVLNHFP